MSEKSSKRNKPAETATPTNPPPPVVVQQQVPLAYADGITNVRVGPYVSRILLSLQSAPVGAEGKQMMVPTLELIMPTQALLTLSKQLDSLLAKHGADLAKALETASKQFAEHTSESNK